MEHCLDVDVAMEDAPVGSGRRNLRMPLKLSVLFGMLQLVVARMLFQHSILLMTMKMKEVVKSR